MKTGIRILGTGRALPSVCVTNDDLSKIVDTNDEWITTRTGIHSRYKCGPGESSATLAVEAGRMALEKSKVCKEEIGAVIVATSTPAYAFPSTACLVQKELGLPEDLLAFDLSAACTGFMFAMQLAQSLLKTLPKKNILLIGCEQLSKVLDYKDRSTCILFGDGAGAAVVTMSDKLYLQKSYSRGDEAVLSCLGVGEDDPFLRMAGSDVFKFAVKALKDVIDELLEESGLTSEEIDYFVCHQANERIIRHVQKKFPGTEDKFYVNIGKYGNTSAASIPIALDELFMEGRLKPGMKIVCAGFGAGLSYSGALLEL